MMIIHGIMIPAAALGMLAFGCSAVMAQGESTSSNATESSTTGTGKVSKLETQHFNR